MNAATFTGGYHSSRLEGSNQADTINQGPVPARYISLAISIYQPNEFDTSTCWPGPWGPGQRLVSRNSLLCDAAKRVSGFLVDYPGFIDNNTVVFTG
ncbi:hypothetical protein GCM10023346_39060 [Arthrobacter gyeryongensis]|uniref:Uncharacterized protein n=1 Tax=Arthrobacter gyeryongensis TaxID=1650592 RepID=A0ABP9SMZ8_9MICC